MYRRITLMLDEKIIKKLRILQSKKIKRTKKSCSFSKILCLVLIEGLKKPNKVLNAIK